MDEHLGVQLDLISECELGCGRRDHVEVERREAGWSYLWEGARMGGRNLFSSKVNRISGTEGERRRLELAVVVRELLHWSEQKAKDDDAEQRA